MLIEEFHVVVKGWKVESYNNPKGERREFVSHHPTSKLEWAQHSAAIQSARIGENLPDWQPHITEVYIECREVTEWRRLDEN